VPVPIGLLSYGSVPARKTVPSWRDEPRERTRKTTSWPLLRLDSILAKSSSLFTGCLFTSRIMSPRPRFTSFREKPGFHVLNNHAFAGRQSRGDRPFPESPANGYAELALFGSALIRRSPVRPQVVRQTVWRDPQWSPGLLRFAVAQETQIRFRSWFSRGNVAHQFGTFHHLLAVNGRNGVAHFQSRLISRAYPPRRWIP